MFVFKNAMKSIARNKARNILAGIVILVIALSSCIALSIREAANSAKQQTLSNLSVTAQLTFDRSSLMSEMEGSGEGGRGAFDKEALSGTTLTLEDYLSYTTLQESTDSYYYTVETSLNATDTLLPYGNTDEDDASTNTVAPEIGGGKSMEEMTAQGDFSITGYSDYTAMLSLFGESGSCSISEGKMFDETSTTLSCIISDELAMYNELSVGDTILLENPNATSETYTLTICGFYSNNSSSEGNQPFASIDPANNIYMNATALSEIITTSSATAGTTTDEEGNEVSTSLTNRLNFTYVFSIVEHYDAFVTSAGELGLPENYIISSNDLAVYENSLAPLETLSNMALWFFLVVLLVGGIILIVLNVFNLRERKYEVGVLTAIGMKKYKVAFQFICELFTVTFIAIIIGTIIGSVSSVPITNTLLATQIESTQSSSDTLNQNFGFDKNSGGMPSDNGGKSPDTASKSVSYIDSVTNATNLIVVIQLVLIGIALTLISSLAALITIMRYEPLKILADRS